MLGHCSQPLLMPHPLTASGLVHLRALNRPPQLSTHLRLPQGVVVGVGASVQRVCAPKHLRACREACAHQLQRQWRPIEEPAHGGGGGEGVCTCRHLFEAVMWGAIKWATGGELPCISDGCLAGHMHEGSRVLQAGEGGAAWSAGGHQPRPCTHCSPGWSTAPAPDHATSWKSACSRRAASAANALSASSSAALLLQLAQAMFPYLRVEGAWASSTSAGQP